jgi:hypothetical protein
MKYLFSLGALFILFQNIDAQARLGSSKSAIMNDFIENNIQVNKADNGREYLSFVSEMSTNLYYFDTNENCETVVIFPKNNTAINFLVEYYNNHYVIIDETHWKMYTSETIAKIDLVYFEQSAMFIWNYSIN